MLISCAVFTSCTDPQNINISDDDASPYIKELATELDSATFQELDEEYRNLHLIYALKPNAAEAWAIKVYGKKFEHLTIGDLLRNIEKREAN